MEYFSVMKKNKIMPLQQYGGTQRLSYKVKLTQRKTNIIYQLYVDSSKNDTNELIYRTQTDSQASKKLMVTKGEMWQRG